MRTYVDFTAAERRIIAERRKYQSANELAAVFETSPKTIGAIVRFHNLRIPNAEWAARLQIDEEDLHLLDEFRLEYKQGTSGYWKVVAVRRGAGGRKHGYTSLGRLILAPPDDMQVDHADHDTLNNRRSNLRVCTASQNQANSGGGIKPGGFRGVTKSYRKYYARLKGRVLGAFTTPEEAARAYDIEAISVFGEFATLNFPVSGNKVGACGTEEAGPAPANLPGQPATPSPAGCPGLLFNRAHGDSTSSQAQQNHG